VEQGGGGVSASSSGPATSSVPAESDSAATTGDALSEAQIHTLAFGSSSGKENSKETVEIPPELKSEEAVAGFDGGAVGGNGSPGSSSGAKMSRHNTDSAASGGENDDILAIETLRVSATPSVSAKLKSAIGMRNRYRPLSASLDLFFSPELLDGADMYACEHCNKRVAQSRGAVRHQSKGGSNKKGAEFVKTRAVKRFMVKRLPDVLVLHLKRFSQVTLLRAGLQKAMGFVEFPLKLDMGKYRCGSSEQGGDEADASETVVYTLVAVVVHGGSLHGGHYTAYVREACDADFLGGWFYCSDSQVLRVKEKDVLSAEAYMLFYERR